MSKERVEKLLKQLEGKDLSSFGVRAKATLKLMKEGKVSERELKFIEKVVKENYT